MLYWLLYLELFPIFSPFRVFRYQTFRIAFASLTALMLAMVLGPWLIQRLREFQIGQYIREEGRSHIRPRRGRRHGWNPHPGVHHRADAAVGRPFQHLHLDRGFRHSGLRFVGFLDDYLKIKRRQNLGLRARDKIFLRLSSA